MTSRTMASPIHMIGLNLYRDMSNVGSPLRSLSSTPRREKKMLPNMIFDENMVQRNDHGFQLYHSTIRSSEALSDDMPYFEVLILDKDDNATVMIGCMSGYGNGTRPTFGASFGYESTGNLWTNNQLKSWGITFGAGDVIGIGVDNNKTIVITFNGRARRVANVKLPTFATLVPFIQVQFGSAQVFVNVGQVPFMYKQKC